MPQDVRSVGERAQAQVAVPPSGAQTRGGGGRRAGSGQGRRQAQAGAGAFRGHDLRRLRDGGHLMEAAEDTYARPLQGEAI